MIASSHRLDQLMVERALVSTRSQAESYIKLGKVLVDGRVITKAGTPVNDAAKVVLTATEQYVSRAALKLASVAKILNLDFRNTVVLDVGSSTGGFTDYALRHGARKVIAVEVGKDQLHPSLRSNPQIELYEQTDVRQLMAGSKDRIDNQSCDQTGGHKSYPKFNVYIEQPDIVVADVSFISLREILPHVATLCGPKTDIIAMVKPQFEAAQSSLKHKGVIKNDRMRRDILKDFEIWAQQRFVTLNKADSDVAGARGNLERFYKLHTL